MPKSHQDELLEDWPRASDGNLLLKVKVGATEREEDKAARRDKVTSTSAGASTCAKHARTVHFSGTSQLYVYERESMSLLQRFAYKEQDRRRFSREAMQDGLLIKILVLVDESPCTSVGESMTYLLRHGIIEREEVVGIEHFCLGIPSSHVALIRRRHAAAVLRKQHQLLHLHEQEVENEDAALILREFAHSSSLRSTKQARIRAGAGM